ncbi:hypothetical protein H5410_025656 [Solanum commersonii]|uniref:Uncharacterized protein n=1 Tax=Solanum commersonii TaxID=4109 RepID=A0A9J5YYL1_SOLCO|nr:hypothetical protein H5410_025656 [Solanum commersonii]
MFQTINSSEPIALLMFYKTYQSQPFGNSLSTSMGYQSVSTMFVLYNSWLCPKWNIVDPTAHLIPTQKTPPSPQDSTLIYKSQIQRQQQQQQQQKEWKNSLTYKARESNSLYLYALLRRARLHDGGCERFVPGCMDVDSTPSFNITRHRMLTLSENFGVGISAAKDLNSGLDHSSEKFVIQIQYPDAVHTPQLDFLLFYQPVHGIAELIPYYTQSCQQNLQIKQLSSDEIPNLPQRYASFELVLQMDVLVMDVQSSSFSYVVNIDTIWKYNPLVIQCSEPILHSIIRPAVFRNIS